jgi:hypothetical protein
VVPDAATGTWWPCWPRGTAPGGSAGQSGSDPAFAPLKADRNKLEYMNFQPDDSNRVN